MTQDVFEGIRVLDLAGGPVAAYAGMLLSDHGADVVRVEPAGGDEYRSDPGFQSMARNARSVVGDPGPLIAVADVVLRVTVEQAAEARAVNPGAVIVSLPPWGSRGELAGQPATADLIAAATGVYWNQISYQETPVRLVLPLVGYSTGILAALAVSAGLLARERQGVAATYEVPWLSGSGAIQIGDVQIPGFPTERPGSGPMGSKGRVPVYRLFEASDGRWFFVACGTTRFYERLLGLIGRADLLGDPRLPDPPWGLVDLEAIAFLVPIVEDIFRTEPRAHWLKALAAEDIPVQPVQTRDEFLSSALAHANQVVTEVEHPDLGVVRLINPPLRLESTPGRVRRHAPRLGEHTTEVSAEWGARPPSPPRPSATEAPLKGVRVVDLASFIAGPVLSRHLAMLGADVVKIEAPAGDPFRAMAITFPGWNQGKRSIALDLNDESDRVLAYRLLARADVAADNFRPGVADRLGVSRHQLRAHNPKLVTVSNTGFGADASMAHLPGFDPLMQALGGVMAAQGGDDEPVFVSVPVHDVFSPLLGAFGVVSALFHRERTGRAQHLDTSLASATVAAQAAELTDYDRRPPIRLGGFDYADGCEQDGSGRWWFQDGPYRVEVGREGWVNHPAVAANELTVEYHHPDFGMIVHPGQLIRGAGPGLGRSPRLDEHRAEILAELDSTGD